MTASSRRPLTKLASQPPMGPIPELRDPYHPDSPIDPAASRDMLSSALTNASPVTLWPDRAKDRTMKTGSARRAETRLLKIARELKKEAAGSFDQYTGGAPVPDVRQPPPSIFPEGDWMHGLGSGLRSFGRGFGGLFQGLGNTGVNAAANIYGGLRSLGRGLGGYRADPYGAAPPLFEMPGLWKSEDSAGAPAAAPAAGGTKPAATKPVAGNVPLGAPPSPFSSAAAPAGAVPLGAPPSPFAPKPAATALAPAPAAAGAADGLALPWQGGMGTPGAITSNLVSAGGPAPAPAAGRQSPFFSRDGGYYLRDMRKGHEGQEMRLNTRDMRDIMAGGSRAAAQLRDYGYAPEQATQYADLAKGQRDWSKLSSLLYNMAVANFAKRANLSMAPGQNPELSTRTIQYGNSLPQYRPSGGSGPEATQLDIPQNFRAGRSEPGASLPVQPASQRIESQGGYMMPPSGEYEPGSASQPALAPVAVPGMAR